MTSFLQAPLRLPQSPRCRAGYRSLRCLPSDLRIGGVHLLSSCIHTNLIQSSRPNIWLSKLEASACPNKVDYLTIIIFLSMASSGVVSKMLIDMFAIFQPQRVIVQSLEYRSKMLAASRDVPAQSVKVSEYSAQFF